jgi:hypothetical protein
MSGRARHLSWHVLLEPMDEDTLRGVASSALIETTPAGASFVFAGRMTTHSFRLVTVHG